MTSLQRKIALLGLFFMATVSVTFANIDPTKQKAKANANDPVALRSDCLQGTSRYDQRVNNVRAALRINGDVWWDGNKAVYVVPKVEPGTGAVEVSSIFAGGVWLGGKDPSGNLKLAATLPNSSKPSTDFWPGPLNVNGQTNKATCDNWDKHFVVKAKDIDSLRLRYWPAAIAAAGGDVSKAVIPDGLIDESIKGWPAAGNRFFFEVNRFVLPKTPQGYGRFHDENSNGVYEPDLGDYPTIDVRGCEKDVYPDEMVYWIYNDAGNVHQAAALSEKIQMEVQVQAFAYQTKDELNDMTFQRYKLINRAKTDIDSMYFAMFVDADLGCYLDDYIGCDTSRSLAYYYNQDAEDGSSGTSCQQNVPTYGTKIPIVGIDYFRGPRDANGKELGMSSFTYFIGQGAPLPGMSDPETAKEFYNYLTGNWKDGTPLTYGGTGYNPGGGGRRIKYAYVDAPNLTGPGIWSCTYPTPAPTSSDRRTIQATGPLLLKPGAINELIIGVPWVPDVKHPNPDIKRLQEADDIAQALFDNCFKIFDGPDAPDVTWVELNREIVAVLSNAATSNNAKEQYKEKGLRIPNFINGNKVNADTNYVFEGYKIYQLQNGDVGTSEFTNPDKARLVAQVDVQNGLSKIYNWKSEIDPNFPIRVINSPILQIAGADRGIEHTFKITEDRFATGDDKKLVNHKKYYFSAIAYGYNNYIPFDAVTSIGQREPYVEGRKNIGDKDRGNKPYEVTPRPIVDQILNSKYGEGPQITRLDGIGNGGKYIEITEASLAKILSGTYDGTLTYKPGQGPINVKIYNPIEVEDGDYTLEMRDGNMTDSILDPKATWILKRNGDPNSIVSERSIDKLNEQVIAKFGFSIAIGQVPDAWTNRTNDKTNGVIGSQVTYKNPGNLWLGAIPDDGAFPIPGILNYLKTTLLEPDFELDPNQALGKTNPNYLFVPYSLCDYRDVPNEPFLTPAWVAAGNATVRANNQLSNLNNVNIVFTSDKSKWSRCAVVETAIPYYYDGGAHPANPAAGITGSPRLETENLVITTGKANNFSLRNAPSVGKDVVGGDNTPTKQITAAEQAAGVTYGMGWFPGYAVDVETGERLNIFFGENSTFDPLLGKYEPGAAGVNRDMMFNPSTQIILDVNPLPFNQGVFTFMGGQHYVYVMKTKYDECLALAGRLNIGGSGIRRTAELKNITWAGMMLTNTKFLSYKDGLIPNDVTVTMRVNNPYLPAKGKGTNGNHPAYQFSLAGKKAAALANQTQIDSSLDYINIVPNPYYGFSAYEINEFATTIKMTNLPPQCKVSIYTLDGKFIRQFRRDEKPIPYPVQGDYGNRSKQIVPDLEWDLKNDKNIPVSSGVYLINVDAGALGSRTLKFFAVNRQFDPSRL